MSLATIISILQALIQFAPEVEQLIPEIIEAVKEAIKTKPTFKTECKAAEELAALLKQYIDSKI